MSREEKAVVPGRLERRLPIAEELDKKRWDRNRTRPGLCSPATSKSMSAYTTWMRPRQGSPPNQESRRNRGYTCDQALSRCPHRGCEAHSARQPAPPVEVMSDDQRRIATDQHPRVVESINEVFDRLDHLTAARDQLTGFEPIGRHEDPVHDAESLLEHAKRCIDTLDNLRTAAVADASHHHRTDLATNVDTTTTASFLRTSTHSEDTARLTAPNLESPHNDSLRAEAR